MFGQRQSMIVYLHSLKHAKILRKYGNIHYISKRLKYAVVYCDMEQIEHMMQKLNKLPFVKKIEQSYRPYLKRNLKIHVLIGQKNTIIANRKIPANFNRGFLFEITHYFIGGIKLFIRKIPIK